MLKIAWSDIYAHPLPRGHRFPMSKYELLPEQLLYEGTITQDNLFTPNYCPEEYITVTHCSDYWERLKEGELTRKEIRRTGFPFSFQLILREVSIMEGTRQAAKYALEDGIAMNIAGGTHHAFTNMGEGFCLLNDDAISARHLLNARRVSRVLIIDLDVHQGNGTAEIFRNEERVFTFSMHGGKNFPYHKQTSDWDIPLADHTDDRPYLAILQEALPRLLDRVEPDIVFYLPGADVLASDKLGRLDVTIQGARERDRMVMEQCKKDDLPIVISMGGGYSERIADIIEA
ncbi:MAG: histone deacetylase, partial [Bacteroidetes bacterium SW_11_45_7]